jgi:hypothetical protein
MIYPALLVEIPLGVNRFNVSRRFAEFCMTVCNAAKKNPARGGNFQLNTI